MRQNFYVLGKTKSTDTHTHPGECVYILHDYDIIL